MKNILGNRKMKKIIIPACIYCPYVSEETDTSPDYDFTIHEWMCSNPQIKKRTINDENGIPEWCPLEDDNFSFAN